MEFRVEVMSRFPTPQSEPHPHPPEDWSPSLLIAALSSAAQSQSDRQNY